MTLKAGYLLAWSDIEVDLHNDYDFVGFEHSVEKSVFTLVWTRTKGSWVAENAPERISVSFSGLSFLKIRHETESLGEPSTLEFAGYLHVEDSDLMDGYLERAEVTGDHHHIFVFDGGLAIKLGAESVEVHVA